MSSELPMPSPTVTKKPLTSFKVMSFDIYGTLIDWESGIVRNLQPLVARLPAHSSLASEYKTKTKTSSSTGSSESSDNDSENRKRLAAKFNEYEAALQAKDPELPYNALLTKLYLQIAQEWGIDGQDGVEDEAKAFGESIGSWAAFPDTVDACQRLSKFYKLIPLSNVDNLSFSKTRAGALKGVDFFRVYTAQDIGSYKPDPRNFEYLVEHARQDAGAGKGEILHTAQSLFHDHVPAKTAGLSSIWINRSGAGMGGEAKELHDQEKLGYGWRFATLGDLADEVEKAFNQGELGPAF